MKCEIVFNPAFDRRSDDPSKNYGIHGVEIRFVVSNEQGAVQFLLYTNWQLPHVTKERAGQHYEPIGGDPHWMERPMPADLGYHSPTPRYDGQITMGPCKYLNGKDCFYDGSGMNAERIYDVLLAEGSDGVWRELEQYHAETFSEATPSQAQAQSGPEEGL